MLCCPEVFGERWDTALSGVLLTDLEGRRKYNYQQLRVSPPHVGAITRDNSHVLVSRRSDAGARVLEVRSVREC